MKSDLILARVANCVPIDGYSRSVIYDLMRNEYKLIPNSLSNMLATLEGKTRTQILSDSAVGYAVTQEYLRFLEENEYIIWINPKLAENFCPLDLDYISPTDLESAIIIIETSADIVKDLIDDLCSLGCKYIDFHFVQECDFNTYKSLLLLIKNRPLDSVGFFFLKGLVSINLDAIEDDFFSESYHISNFTVYNAPTQIQNRINFTSVTFTSEAYDQTITVSPRQFHVNIEAFCEAHAFNLFYHKKLIFTNQECSELENHTNPALVRYTDKESITAKLTDVEYLNFCSITKDQINVCKNCEFRYMCCDSRLPIQLENGDWSFKEECAYNPYLCKWSWEEGYKSLQESGVTVCNKNGLTINTAVFDRVFHNTWDE